MSFVAVHNTDPVEFLESLQQATKGFIKTSGTLRSSALLLLSSPLLAVPCCAVLCSHHNGWRISSHSTDFFPVRIGMVLEPFLRLLNQGNFHIRPSPFCGFATCIVPTSVPPAAQQTQPQPVESKLSLAEFGCTLDGAYVDTSSPYFSDPKRSKLVPLSRILDLAGLYQRVLPVVQQLEKQKPNYWTATAIKKVGIASILSLLA